MKYDSLTIRGVSPNWVGTDPQPFKESDLYWVCGKCQDKLPHTLDYWDHKQVCINERGEENA